MQTENKEWTKAPRNDKAREKTKNQKERKMKTQKEWTMTNRLLHGVIFKKQKANI